jgi:hypothetical protein
MNTVNPRMEFLWAVLTPVAAIVVLLTLTAILTATTATSHFIDILEELSAHVHGDLRQVRRKRWDYSSTTGFAQARKYL